jgi:hypothetical protein
VLSLELFHCVASKLYDALFLWIAWHLHEAQGSFYHCGDGSGEDWICYIVKLLVDITWVDASTFRSVGPVLFLR